MNVTWTYMKYDWFCMRSNSHVLTYIQFITHIVDVCIPECMLNVFLYASVFACIVLDGFACLVWHNKKRTTKHEAKHARCPACELRCEPISWEERQLFVCFLRVFLASLGGEDLAECRRSLVFYLSEASDVFRLHWPRYCVRPVACKVSLYHQPANEQHVWSLFGRAHIQHLYIQGCAFNVLLL